MGKFTRTVGLIGEEGIAKLQSSKVMVLGVGGVGSFVVEGLARAGLGTIGMVDKDVVDVSNINRQIHSNMDTVGLIKVDVMSERVKSINPELEVIAHHKLIDTTTLSELELEKYDYIVDAIDMVTAKLLVAKFCYDNKIPLVSSMGTGNKLHPDRFKFGDIFNTNVCPLAKVMRKELKAIGVPKLKVIYSDEVPLKNGRRTPSSISFVPSVVGLMICGYVVRELLTLQQ